MGVLAGSSVLRGSSVLQGAGVLAGSGVLAAGVGGGGYTPAPSRSRGFQITGTAITNIPVNISYLFLDGPDSEIDLAAGVTTGQWDSGPGPWKGRWFHVPAGQYTFKLHQGHPTRTNVGIRGWNGPSIPTSHDALTLANGWTGVHVGGWYNNSNENTTSWNIAANKQYVCVEFESGAAAASWSPGTFELL